MADSAVESSQPDEASRNKDGNENEKPAVEQANADEEAAIIAEPLSASTERPVSIEKDASIDREAIDFVKRGSALTKVRSSGRYVRNFYVDDEGVTFRYRDSHKSSCFSRVVGHRADFSKIRLNHVKEIRADKADKAMTKSKKRSFRSKSAHHKQSSCFTLVVGEDLKTLNLVARDEHEKQLWVRGLNCLIKNSESATLHDRQENWLSEKFHEADRDGNGTIQANEIVLFMQSLNFSPKRTETLHDFVKAKAMSKQEFVAFFRSLSKREELEDMFKEHAATDRGDFLGPSELVKFFKQTQNEDLNLSDAEQLIRDSEPCPDLAKQLRLSIAGFHELFANERMNIKKPICRKVYQDMTQPMSHYFINSSHNTYLEGNQLFGVSSVEQYIRVLTHRCRCVELDVWDGDDGEPIIYHGYTLTTKISFRDVLEGIRDYAFKKTQYPVILSLENHCSVEQQRLMAEYLRITFGSQLLTEPLDDSCTRLPSPEELKNKVIIKAKKLPTDVVDGADDDDSEEDEAADIPDENVQKEVKERSAMERKTHLATELSDCVVICQSASFKSFATSAAKLTFANISSFSEDKALKLCTNEAVKFVRHNAWQMSRIYPAGRRTGSSNYNPMPMWNVGCQVVALNFQTRDEPLLLNYGRFQDNGNCGYVLKPEFMRHRDSTFDPNGPFPGEDSRTFKVRVISGFGLPKKPSDHSASILDPYVKVKVYGVEVDCDEQATRIIENNGFHPIWNEELPPFHLRCPELAIISFQVYDSSRSKDDDVMVAQDYFPFNCMQTGYRMISLRDAQGNPIGNTSLFVHTSISQP